MAERYVRSEGTVLLSGVQALVRVLLEARARDATASLDTAALVSGYQGSPLGGFDLELGRRRELLQQRRIIHQPAVNEELAATAIMGSQLAAGRPDALARGVLGMWYGKAPGLDRASDAIRHGNLIGADPHGGVVVVVGDDAQAKSSTVPSGSEPLLHALGLPILVAPDPAGVLELGLHALAMSRLSGCWVGLKLATSVADAVQSVQLASDLHAFRSPSVEIDGSEFRHRPTAHLLGNTLIELEQSQYGARLEVARRYGAANALNEITCRGDRDKIGIVAGGVTYLDTLGALRLLGIALADDEPRGIRVLKLTMPYPMDPRVVREFAAGLSTIVVVEEKRGFIELFIKEALHGVADAPLVLGKLDARDRPLIPAHGELTSATIAQALSRELLEPAAADAAVRTLADPPVTGAGLAPAAYFCSGCPHSTGTRAPPDAVVGAGIGCHALAMTMNPERVGDIVGLTQMGGEGAQWLGMAPFVGTEHFIQNIGDGTYTHSGSLAIRAAVAASANITFKLLVNAAVAMTGGQRPSGARSIADLTRVLAGEGVTRIIVTAEDIDSYRDVELSATASVWHRDRIIEAQRLLAAEGGVTVLIHDQRCAIEKRRGRKRGTLADPGMRVFINERICEGCGDCGRKSNCLSVHPVDTEYGRKSQIHQSSCNKDFTCMDGDCPSFLQVIPASPRHTPRKAVASAVDDLPLPDATRAPQSANVRISGIGGTGVVTAAQLLSAAAVIDGLSARGLDQTGLAQKAGPVVSDVRISASASSEPPRLGPGECDVYLACDLLAAAQEHPLSAASGRRTLAIVNTALTPTGMQVAEITAPRHDTATLVAAIEARVRPGGLTTLDATAKSIAMFGSDQTANVLMLGFASQLGALPLQPASIEQAIAANGVAVPENLAAFRHGRRLALDGDAGGNSHGVAATGPGIADALARLIKAPPESELRRLVEIRVPELRAYQSASYARRYAELVEQVRKREQDATGDAAGPVAEAVARALHHLMAYKDEYEVARLSLDPDLRAAVQAEFGPRARIAFRLHPPVLRALGMKRKLTLGEWFVPVLRVLRAMRRVRGTRFDPFGRAQVRQLERELVDEYRSTVVSSLELLDRDTAEEIATILRLPELVRGYETIKLANTERYRAELGSRLTALRARSVRGAADRNGARSH